MVDTSTEKRWDGASWIDLTLAKRWNGAAWVDIAFPGGGGGGALSATASDGSVTGSVFMAEPADPFKTVVSNSTTVTATGGTGPYTYSWARITGASAVNVSNPANPTVSFNANVNKNGARSATYRCVVTDAVSATTFVDVSVFLEYNTDI